MKSGLNSDFRVQVRKQEDDEDRQFSKFYQGIFSVNLNYLVTITFIPEFTRTGKTWFLDIPDNVDIVHSSQEARLFTAALSDIMVTPDDSRAGQEELIPIPHPPPPIPDFGPQMGVIFYVTAEQFTRFSQELAVIEEQTFSVYGSFAVSKLEHFECVQFILNKVITSEHFSEAHLTMLGRKRASRSLHQPPKKRAATESTSYTPRAKATGLKEQRAFALKLSG
ncbi:MAG: hypothetical protein ACPGWR_05860 [Ardenticatenaceae bacterium]